MGIVQDVAKSFAGVKGDEMSVIQFSPTPTNPGFLCYQVQHIAPKGQTAETSGVTSAQTCPGAVGQWVKVRQRQSGTGNGMVSTANRTSCNP